MGSRRGDLSDPSCSVYLKHLFRSKNNYQLKLTINKWIKSAPCRMHHFKFHEMRRRNPTCLGEAKEHASVLMLLYERSYDLSETSAKI